MDDPGVKLCTVCGVATSRAGSRCTDRVFEWIDVLGATDRTFTLTQSTASISPGCQVLSKNGSSGP